MKVMTVAKPKENDQQRGAGMDQPPALSRSRAGTTIIVCILAGFIFVLTQPSTTLMHRPSAARSLRSSKLKGNSGVEEIGTVDIVSANEQERAGTNKTLPNVLFVGAQKAGTTAIADWLLFKNGVCHGKIFEGEPGYYGKEVHFFGSDDRFKQGLDFYAKRFEHCQNESLIMDATPRYLRWASRIHSFYEAADEHLLKNLKIMVSLRDPISRELSIYNHMLDFNLEHNPDPNCPSEWYTAIARPDGSMMSFDDYVDEIVIPNLKDPSRDNFSMYAKDLKEWFQLFDRMNILVLSYDELKTNSNQTQYRVKTFLGHDEFQGTFERVNNKSFSGKVALPSCKAREKLKKVFDPLNEELYELLDSHVGPSMEQWPFPRFQLGECNSN